MNRYDRYKDSGIPWLGKVPEHWDKIAVHYLVNLKSGNSITALDLVENGEYPVFGGGGFRGYINTFTHCGKFNLIGRQGALCGNVTLVNGKFFATEHAIVVTPIKNVDTKWFYYLLITMNLNQYSTSAAQPGISAEVIGRLRVPLPSYEEQTAIAQYLDTKLGEIDALIGKQQTLLEKLAEQRTAVITHAVTKGLNPAAPMKNSGVEWLGDVPAHWEVLSIKRLSQVKRGASPRPIDNPDYFDDDGEYAWVRIADVTASNMYLLETTQRLSDLGKSFSVPLLPNSLFLSIAGSVGKPIITKIKACIHDGFVYFPEYKNNIKFLYYIFYSGQPYLGLGKMGTQLNLNTDTVGTIKISLPPKEEQTAITDYLDQETAKIDRLCDTVNQTIGRLKEYRTALITQAVTGKIKITDE